MDGYDENEEDLIGFPIQDMDISVHMKNIPAYFLPNFHGMEKNIVYVVILEEKG